jgi:hypothetical protein
VLITIWARAEFNAGLIASSLPPLKAQFERILRQWFHVKSGLNTSTGGTPTYALQSYGRTRQSRLPDDEFGKHAPAIRVRDHDDVESLEEEDQRHILKAQQQGRTDSQSGSDGADDRGNNWITKSVEYTVAHEARSVKDHAK